MAGQNRNTQLNCVSFTKLVESNPVAIIKLAKDNHIVYANPTRAEELLDIQESKIGETTYEDRNWVITDLEGDKLERENLHFQKVQAGSMEREFKSDRRTSESCDWMVKLAAGGR